MYYQVSIFSQNHPNLVFDYWCKTSMYLCFSGMPLTSPALCFFPYKLQHPATPVGGEFQKCISYFFSLICALISQHLSESFYHLPRLWAVYVVFHYQHQLNDLKVYHDDYSWAACIHLLPSPTSLATVHLVEAVQHCIFGYTITIWKPLSPSGCWFYKPVQYSHSS